MKKQLSNTVMQRACRGFTLAELLVSIGVVALVVLLVTQLLNSATAITRTGNKHVDTDTQARVVLDRMALDFAQMLKRTDVDYYVKSPSGSYHKNPHGKLVGKLVPGQQGSDQIAFFSQVPGYNSTGSNSSTQSPISLVSYRVNSDSTSSKYLQLQRMGKGLLWNGVDNPNKATNNPNYTSPMVFMPILIGDRWPAATDGSATDKDYETIGPQVFRLEYYFLMKDGTVTDVPSESWDNTKTISANLNAFADIEAIAVAIAVIDPASLSMISQTQLLNLVSDLPDFQTAHGNGYGNPNKTVSSLESIWKSALESDIATGQAGGSPFPPAAAASVKIYSRFFDLKTLPTF
jgi:prepilin-type N-terminal cleavage/methylation domain-containing protein